MSYTIRQFQADEWEQYKAIRLEALQLEPGKFGNTHATEAAYEDFIWKDRLASEKNACFGLYNVQELIGLTSIFCESELWEDAYMTQSYIKQAHRGIGLSKMLYDARLRWAKEKGIKKLIIGHRESNLVSRAANQRYGFQYTHRVARSWPDGVDEDMVYYSLLL